MNSSILYFIVSLMGVLLVLVHIINVHYYLKFKMNIMGERVEPKSIGYKKYQSFSSKKGRLVAWIILLCTSANLLVSINKVLNTDGKRVLAVSAALIIAPFVLSLIAVKEKIESASKE